MLLLINYLPHLAIFAPVIQKQSTQVHFTNNVSKEKKK